MTERPAPVVALADQQRSAALPVLVPLRSTILFGAVATASFTCLALGWQEARRWQGALFADSMVALNLAAFLLVFALARRARRQPSFLANLRFHAALFGWMSWCAFPWMGEGL